MDIWKNIVNLFERWSRALRRWRESRPHQVQLAAVGAVPTLIAIGVAVYYIIQPPTMPITTFMQNLEQGLVESATIVNREGSYNITTVVAGEKYFVKSPLVYISSSGDKEGRNIIQILTDKGVEVEIVNDLINKFVLLSVVLLPVIIVSVVVAWFLALVSGRMNA